VPQNSSSEGRRGEPPRTSDLAATSPAGAPPGYLGQLDRDFQSRLETEHSGCDRADCFFYHCIELPNGDMIPGPWDLREREATYLGNVALQGARVLELGPASGALTYYMERQGADVVSFDAGYDVGIDLHPHPDNADMSQLQLDHARLVGSLQNAWWYLHRAYASHAAAVYGDIYSLPDDIGEFDISVFAAILLHLRNPVAALEQAARRTRRTIVVTESWPFGTETLHDNVMKIFPWGESGRWTVWWAISAGATVAMLQTLGFDQVKVTEHTQRHQLGHDANAEYCEMPMYTVVGERSRPVPASVSS
jgi:O-methyltransferase